MTRRDPSTYLVAVSSVLMLRPVRSVAEGLAASRELASVRFLARVRSQMGLQILQPRVSFVTSLELSK